LAGEIDFFLENSATKQSSLLAYNVLTRYNSIYIFFKKIFLWPMPLFLHFNAQTMHFKSFYTQQQGYVSLKTLYPGGI
jgi:hypothetical protein